MTRVTILGAGDMGTALLTPLHAGGHELRLWGTERDAAIIAALHRGDPHPRLGIPIPPGVSTFDDAEVAAALDGAEIVVVAITSNAIRPVIGRIADALGEPRAMVVVGKGFDSGPNGDEILLLPHVLGEFSQAPVVGVGGPSIAKEVAIGTPTAATFGSADPGALAFTQQVFSTSAYSIETTDDVAGLEVAAAMKNAYGVAIGIADGIEKRTGLPHANMRAALLPHAVAEMSLLAESLGGGVRQSPVLRCGRSPDCHRRPQPPAGRAYRHGIERRRGIPGAHRRRHYDRGLPGRRLWLPPRPAFDSGGRTRSRRYPVLDALYRILYEGAPASESLWGAIRSPSGPVPAA